MLICCWVSSTIIIPRTRGEKFLHRGSVERVLYCGSIDNYADPLLGIKHHNNSQNKRGEVSKPWKCGKGPTLWKHKGLIRCWVSSTIIIPRIRGERFLHRGSVERVLHRGSIEDYVDLLLGIKHHNNSQKKRGDVPTLWKCGKGLTP